MTATTPANRPRRNDPTGPASRDAATARGNDPEQEEKKKKKKARRIRWGRIPGRLILAVCFVVGALALGVAVIPFSTTADDGTELRCGPAVFEALMPADPEFTEVPENAGCADPAIARLKIAGGVLVGALVIAGITERQTRRGSRQRDARWLASSPTRSSRRRRDRRDSSSPKDRTGKAVGPASRDDRSLPPARS